MGSAWLSRLAVAAAAAGAVTLMTATSAWAVEPVTINLHPDHDNVTAEEFDGETCTGPFKDLPEGLDGWHFILPGASGDSFVQLNLVFTKPDGAEAVTITSADSNNPSEDATAPLGEWYGYFDNAASDERHAYVFTEAGWTLTSGTAQVIGAAAQPSDVFNLSHTCAGDGTPPTDPPPTSEPPGNGSSPPASSPGGGGSGDLPVTGTAIGGMLITGIGLVAAGIALLAIRRRRDLNDLTES